MDFLKPVLPLDQAAGRPRHLLSPKSIDELWKDPNRNVL